MALRPQQTHSYQLAFNIQAKEICSRILHACQVGALVCGVVGCPCSGEKLTCRVTHNALKYVSVNIAQRHRETQNQGFMVSGEGGTSK